MACIYFNLKYTCIGASQKALVIKNPSANAEEIRYPISIPGSNISPRERNGYSL